MNPEIDFYYKNSKIRTIQIDYSKLNYKSTDKTLLKEIMKDCVLNILGL